MKKKEVVRKALNEVTCIRRPGSNCDGCILKCVPIPICNQVMEELTGLSCFGEEIIFVRKKKKEESTKEDKEERDLLKEKINRRFRKAMSVPICSCENK